MDDYFNVVADEPCLKRFVVCDSCDETPCAVSLSGRYAPVAGSKKRWAMLTA